MCIRDRFVDDVVSKEGTNSVGFSKGISVSVASTFSGDVSIGGTLTYEDVTNVDAVGLITARNGIKFGVAGVGGTIAANGNTTLAGVVTATSFSGDGSALTGMANTANVSTTGLNVVGVSTLGNDVIFTGATANVTWDKSEDDLVFADDARAKFGTGLDLHIYHNGSNSVIREEGTGNLNIQTTGGNVDILVNTTETAAKFISDGAVELYNNNAKKLETLSTGVQVTGVTSTTSLSVGPGVLQEKLYNVASALTGTVNFDVVTNGLVQYYTTNSSGTFIVNLRGDGSTTFNSLMDIGKTTVFTVYSAQNNASYYMTDFKIDGSSITEKWNGGTAPSAGTASGTDVYTFNIMKTADATFTVFATFSNFA